jgi:hypothetical protein
MFVSQLQFLAKSCNGIISISFVYLSEEDDIASTANLSVDLEM